MKMPQPFLLELAELCEKHGNVAFTYTIDDDGIHILINGAEIFAGFLESGDVPEVLRAASAPDA